MNYINTAWFMAGWSEELTAQPLSLAIDSGGTRERRKIQALLKGEMA